MTQRRKRSSPKWPIVVLLLLLAAILACLFLGRWQLRIDLPGGAETTVEFGQDTLRQIPGAYTLPGAAYEEEGFSAVDEADGDLTSLVERRESDGVVYYRVADHSGNVAQAQRQIVYDDPVAPILTLAGGSELTLDYGTAYVEPGYTAMDNADGDLTAFVSVSGAVDPETPGVYELRYTVRRPCWRSWTNTT